MRIDGFAVPSLIFLVLLVCSSTARADPITFTIGNNPEPDEENILLNTGVTGTPTSAVFGVTNQTRILIAFNTVTDILVVPASGQARIEALDGLINTITITIPNGGTFRDIILNPFAGSGTATVQVVTENSRTFFSYTLGNGENFLTIIAGPESRPMLSVSIIAPDGFTDLREPRISGVSGGVPEPVPEPATMVLLGLGLLGVVARRRSR